MAVWFAIFAALGAAGTWLARRYALARALVDHPGERRSHAVPTPRGGGIAVVLALLAATAVLAWNEPARVLPATAFAGGLAAVALAGLIDDHRPLSPWIRLLVHAAAAGALALAWVVSGGGWVAACIGFLACLSLTNVWNFMDGINGLAATQAVLVAVAVATAAGEWMLIPVALAASCLGFLPFNFPRARIFLGDVGSGAIGFTVGAMWLFVERPEGAVVVALGVSAFMVDAGLTLAGRIARGERWWTPHVRHLYQQCARHWGHGRVTACYGAWTVLAIAVAHVAQTLAAGLMWSVTAAWYTCAALLWLWLQSCVGGRSRMDAAGNKDEGGLR